MKQIDKKSLLIIAAVALFMTCFGLGSVPLLDPDEPVYAETAREMLLYGDFLSPRIYDAFWFDKPPFYYWLVAGMQTLLGFSETAARLPAALMGSLTVLILYICVTRLFNERAGFWSAIVLATSVEFFYLSKAAVTDTTLLFFLTSSLLAFLHRKYWLMYVLMALGTLVKGPIAIVFPGAIIFLYLLFLGKLREILNMHPLRGLLLYLLLAAPWYYAMYTVHGSVFVETFLGFHNITRFTTAEHADRVVFWYYLPVLFLGFFPWIGLLPQAVKASISDSRIDEMRLLLFMHVWWLFVFIFFTVCRTKLVSYILPLFPALAVVVGWHISQMMAKFKNNTTFYGWMLSSGLCFILLGAGWIAGGQFLPEVFFATTVLGVLTLILAAAVIYTLWVYRDIQLAAALHGLTALCTMVIVFGFALPQLAPRFSMETMAAYYRDNCEKELPIHVDKFLRPGFKYYSGANGIELRPKTGDLRDALGDGKDKYIMVRGLELRRYRKGSHHEEHFTVLHEEGDIYLLRQLATAGEGDSRREKGEK